MKNKKWLEAIASLEFCQLCGAYGVQVAHRNFNKGMGQKNSDHLTAALCPSCHYEIDNGSNMSRDERRALMDRAIVNSIDELIRRGKVGLLK